MQPTTNLLNIQKLIFLLDDFHFNHFTQFLEENNAALPLQLCLVIRKKLPEFETIDELNQQIYGAYNEQSKLNFNQLSVHTFKLTWHLALHYPSYLINNITRVQKHINNGELEMAEFMANTTLEIAEKIGDYTTQTSILELMLHLFIILKNDKLISKAASQLELAQKHRKLYSS
jgi:hypothetical protein